jgi:Poxvirus A32 protein/C2H2 type zinc-finger (2 copies)
MKVHPITQIDDSEVQIEEAEPFVIKYEQLRENAVNFTVEIPEFPKNEDATYFIHPFSCKIIGPRGSGKTSFTVSYIQKIASLMFSKIFILTASQEQPLYDLLKNSEQIIFITLDELDAVAKSQRDVLLVLDDMMQEVRYNHTLEAVFTRGRHKRISVMSLEQDLFYSSHIERRNADYFVLMRMRDTSSHREFYKKFCTDVQHWRFIDVYRYAISNPLGYLILDFVSYKFKYRINSLNLYFDINTSKIKCIDKSVDSKVIEEANTQLMNRFNSTITDMNKGKKTFENEQPGELIFTRDRLPLEKHEPREQPRPAAPRYVCDICNEDYYQECALTIHRILDHPPESSTSQAGSSVINSVNKCQVCHEDFSDTRNPKIAVVNHMVFNHKISVSKGLRCYLCEKGYPDMNSIIGHMQVTHENEFEDIDKLTLRPPQQDEPEETQVAPIITEFTCLVCMKDYSNFYDPRLTLVCHMRGNHHIALSEKYFTCLFCKRSFSSVNHIITHMERKHVDKFEMNDKFNRLMVLPWKCDEPNEAANSDYSDTD